MVEPRLGVPMICSFFVLPLAQVGNACLQGGPTLTKDALAWLAEETFKIDAPTELGSYRSKGRHLLGRRLFQIHHAAADASRQLGIVSLELARGKETRVIAVGHGEDDADGGGCICRHETVAIVATVLVAVQSLVEGSFTVGGFIVR